MCFFCVIDDQKDQKAGKRDGYVSVQVGKQQQDTSGHGRRGEAAVGFFTLLIHITFTKITDGSPLYLSLIAL